MAVTAAQMLQRQGVDIISVVPNASTTLYGNTMCFVDAATGYATDVVNSGANKFLAIVWNDIDNSAGAAGDKYDDGWTCGRFLLTGSGFAQTSVGKKVYATDNFTITLTATNGSYVGKVTEYVSSTQVWVELDAQNSTPNGQPTEVQVLAAAGSVQGDAGAITAGSGALIHATGADATKGIILPAAAAGKQYVIKNDDTANAVLKVYPATGDAINAIAANSAISMAAKTSMVIHAIDGTTWFTVPLLPS